jgi:hypothetical protein
MLTVTPQTDAQRFHELIQHAQDGSPIAMAAIQSRLQGIVLQAPPRIVLALARRFLDLRETGDDSAA